MVWIRNKIKNSWNNRNFCKRQIKWYLKKLIWNYKLKIIRFQITSKDFRISLVRLFKELIRCQIIMKTFQIIIQIKEHKRMSFLRLKNKFKKNQQRKFRNKINQKIRTLKFVNLKIIFINHNYQISEDCFSELFIQIKQIWVRGQLLLRWRSQSLLWI